MSEQPNVPIVRLATGVPGLDEVLGGGLPEYSLTLIAGPPGAGKTILAHQIVFALAAPARPALYLTILGEPPLKMLRYQREMAFFDPARVGESIHFVSLTDALLDQGLGAVLARVVERVEATSPGLVVVDSFHGTMRSARGAGADRRELAGFMQRLAVELAGRQATTFLVGRLVSGETSDDPLFTVADGILRLTQDLEGNASVRKLQVLKLRGQATLSGLHPFRIGAAGLRIFPRIQPPPEPAERPLPDVRIDAGVPGLAGLTGGGLLVGDAVLVTGPSGAGKSILATQFAVAGARADEPGVVAIFDEWPGVYLRRAAGLGFDLPALERAGRLRLLHFYLRALDLSPSEVFQAIGEAVAQLGARRVVLDSLAGFELALAQAYREEYREALYQLVGALTATGVTVLLTAESSQEDAAALRFPYAVSILADDIILLRYVEESPGRLGKSLAVIKMRGSGHDAEFRPYDIGAGGLVVRGAPPGKPGAQTALGDRDTPR